MKIVRLKVKVNNEEINKFERLASELKETLTIDSAHDIYMMYIIEVSVRLYLAFQMID